MIERWTTLSSRAAFEDRWLRLRVDACRTAGGVHVDPYYVMECPPWVNIVPVTTKREIVLVRQYRHALGRIVTEIPGGVMESRDASPEAAARRELQEETGFGGGEFVRTAELAVNPATHDNLTYSFLATDVERLGRPSPDESEELEVIVQPLAEVKRALLNGEFIHSLNVASLLHALVRLGELKP